MWLRSFITATLSVHLPRSHKETAFPPMPSSSVVEPCYKYYSVVH